jgi:dihydroxy-acid dehydratase
MKKDSSTFWKKSRVELRAAGFEPDKTAKTSAVVTIASAYTNAHRCNNRVRTIGDLLVELLAERGGNGLIVGAPAVSDALTQGTPTAGYSLVSRDVVADCFEIGHYAHHGDAMIVISGCDKTGAAALMPLARTNAFGLVLYPGTSSPGRVSFGAWAAKGNNLTIMDYVEGRAANEAGRISGEELLELESNVMPGSGTCGAMFTANTMSTIAEAMGMMLPRGASHPADYKAGSDIHADVRAQAKASIDALYALMAANIRPRDIMTEKAFENAIATVYAMGGSTNMYLHLLAIAREAQVPITIERIQQVGERMPLICNLQPHGPYAMVSLHADRRRAVVMKELLRNGFLHGDVMTVTGKTLAENLAGPDPRGARKARRRRARVEALGAGEQPHQRAEGQHRARELPAEAQRQDSREGRVPRHRARVRIRGRHDEGNPRRRDRARQRRRGAQRGSGGRSRHARDGDAHHPAPGTRAGRRRGADHRRPVLGRLARHPDRPHLAGSGARRPDRRGARRRHDRDRSRRKRTLNLEIPTRSSRAAWPTGVRLPPKTARARAPCTTSTRSWFRRRIMGVWCKEAPSSRPERRRRGVERPFFRLRSPNRGKEVSPLRLATRGSGRDDGYFICSSALQ